MTRCSALRSALDWSQPKLADHLGVAQSTISRIEGGQREPGPISKMLDALALQHDLAHLTAALYAAAEAAE